MQKKNVIIDYNLGNLHSVNQAMTNVGLDVIITDNPQEIEFADSIILPGVGAFGKAMNNLKKLDLVNPLMRFAVSGKPFFGICLGLQLLFTESEEFKKEIGLGLLKGHVRKFNPLDNQGKIRKIPHIGWNNITKINGVSWNHTPFKDIEEGDYLYFVHSFYVDPEEPIGLSSTNYDEQNFISSILKQNIFACQFHPEKSGNVGLKIYNSWAIMNNLK